MLLNRGISLLAIYFCYSGDMDRVHDYAIILRRKNWGEADVLVTLLAKEQGKLRAIAKGARKVSSRLVGHIEPFSVISGMIALKPSISILSQVTLEHSTEGVAEDHDILQKLSLLAEIVDKGLEEGMINQAVYHLMVEGSLRIRSKPNTLLSLGMMMRLLGLLGYAPQITHCARCNERFKAGASFGWSHEVGGVVMNQCVLLSRAQTFQSGEDGVKVLRFLQQHALSDIERLKLSPTIGNELNYLMTNYARYMLESPLLAAQFGRTNEYLGGN